MRHTKTVGSRVSLIVTVAIVLVVGAAFVLTQIQGMQPSGGYAVVHDGDGGVQSFALDGSDGTEFTVTSSYGTNTITIEDGSVRVSEADCANQDCVRQGAIDRMGQQIICLPHKLWVEIAETRDGSDDSPLSSASSSLSSSAGYDTVAR